MFKLLFIIGAAAFLFVFWYESAGAQPITQSGAYFGSGSYLDLVRIDCVGMAGEIPTSGTGYTTGFYGNIDVPQYLNSVGIPVNYGSGFLTAFGFLNLDAVINEDFGEMFVGCGQIRLSLLDRAVYWLFFALLVAGFASVTYGLLLVLIFMILMVPIKYLYRKFRGKLWT